MRTLLSGAVIKSKHIVQRGIWLAFGQSAPLIRISCPGMTIASQLSPKSSKTPFGQNQATEQSSHFIHRIIHRISNEDRDFRALASMRVRGRATAMSDRSSLAK
jgi:hypothetical protein